MAYCARADVQRELGITDADITANADLGTLIDDAISEAQQYIDNETTRTFQAAADSTRRYTVGKHTDGAYLYFDTDVAEITSIANNGRTYTASDFITEPLNAPPYYAVKLLSAGWSYGASGPDAAITVTGKFAYSTEPPADIRRACKRLAAYFFRLKDAQTYDTVADASTGLVTVPAGIPADVLKILKNYRPIV